MKNISIWAVWAIFIGFCAVTAAYLELTNWADRPAGTEIWEKTFTVSPGQSLQATAESLKREGLMVAPIRFRIYGRLKGIDKQIKAGEYLLSAAMSPNEIFATLIAGRVRLYRLTIPEGFNLRQIAEMVEKKGLGSSTEFYHAATDPKQLMENGIPADSFEGYLFPDTYHFPKGIEPEQMIQIMVARFRSVFSPDWHMRAQDLGLTGHQIVTLASIVEKETGAVAERPIIASVFHNRLDRSMRLEADPTVIYGIENFNGDITRKDLETPTPYNTYVIPGLPPGPIANPGFASLKAALYPAETKFLFFVAKKDRTHKFSTNYKEHLRAVRRYQLGK